MKNVIILFTRVPKEGTTKTRLYDFVTPKQAIIIQEKLLKENYRILKNSGYEVKVYHDGTGSDDEYMRKLIPENCFYYQQGQDLGEKMYNAIEKESSSYSKVLLVGSDIVGLTKEIIDSSFLELDNNDVVINPSVDGGYYLVAMKKAIKEVFAIDKYGDSSVFEKVLGQCELYNYRYFIGKTATDIDTKEDLLTFETGFDKISLLGAGEYNINFSYNHTSKEKRVLRLNMKSQMNLPNQMRYEFETLKLLEDSGVTPKPYLLEEKPKLMPYSYLTMEFLQGRPLDYNKDLAIASYLLSKIHNHKFNEDNILIKAANPFQLMYDECCSMANVYIEWDFSDKIVVDYLKKFLEVCKNLIPDDYFVDRPCIINTELNSGNFLIGSTFNNSYVIDWEKALVGECEQDLAHFLAPTTTYWKTDKILTFEEIDNFLDDYSKYRDYDREKFKRYFIFTCLRGVTWCSMAYRQYSEKDKILRDDFTFNKISSYIDLKFLENLAVHFGIKK